MEEQVPPHFMVPKIAPYSGSGDPKSHLKAFGAQMLISGAPTSSDARCLWALSLNHFAMVQKNSR